MRKHFTRFISALLVVVMVLTMLPTLAFAAKESYPATPLADIPADNQSVVIYSASAGGVFSGAIDGGSIGI